MISGPPTPTSWWPLRWRTRSPPPTPADPRPPDHRRRQRPDDPEADLILQDRGITVIPDVLANSGGVTVSYFEWVQDISAFFWSEEEINARLERIMREAFAAVWEAARQKGISLRTAAFVLGCERVLMAHKLRGLYP
jgi:glutamate dehydrogenase (NAD(P)+)